MVFPILNVSPRGPDPEFPGFSKIWRFSLVVFPISNVSPRGPDLDFPGFVKTVRAMDLKLRGLYPRFTVYWITGLTPGLPD